MLYLFLAILGSAGFAMILKWSVKKAKNKEYVLMGNYFSALLITGVVFLFSAQKGISSTQPLNIVLLFSFSTLAGIVHFGAFRLYQSSIQVNGIAITGAFAKMGILIPTLVSMIIWNEYPSIAQGLGIALTLFALLYYYTPQKNQCSTLRISYLLLFLMIVNGSADFMTKIFQKNFELVHMDAFLAILFLVGLLISGFFAIRAASFSLTDFGIGMFLGIPIVLSFYFLILALDYIIAAIVFPVFSAGSLVAITLASILFFKEMPGRKEWITMSGILLALILINA